MPTDEEVALRAVVDGFVGATTNDRERRLAVLEALAAQIDEGKDDLGVPPDGVEIDQNAWVSHALGAWRDTQLGTLLPDQTQVKRACRMLAEALLQRFREPSPLGKCAEYKLGRRGYQTRLWLSQDLAVDLRDLLDEDGFKLPGRRVESVSRQQSDAPARALTSADVKAKLRNRADELKRFHVARLEVFGSVARGEARPDSDVDFMVTLDRPTTAADYFGLKFFLEDLLGCSVDLVARAAIPTDRLARIEREAVHVA